MKLRTKMLLAACMLSVAFSYWHSHYALPLGMGFAFGMGNWAGETDPR